MPDFNRSGSGDVVDLENYTAITLALSTSAAQTAALAEGIYAVWASAECFIRVSPSAAAVTTANGFVLRASTTVNVRVRSGSKIEAIAASGTPTLSIHKVG